MLRRCLRWLQEKRPPRGAAPATAAQDAAGEKAPPRGSEDYYARLLHNIEVYDGTERGQQSLAERN